MSQERPIYEEPQDGNRRRYNNAYVRQSFIPTTTATTDATSLDQFDFKENNNIQTGVPLSLQKSRRQKRNKICAVRILISLLLVLVIVLSVLYGLSFMDKPSMTCDDDDKYTDFAISLTKPIGYQKGQFVLSNGFKTMNTSSPITLCVSFWRKQSPGNSKISFLVEVVRVVPNSDIKDRFITGLFILEDNLYFQWFDKSVMILSDLPRERWYPVCLVVESDSDIMQVYHKVYSVDQKHEVRAKNVTTNGFVNKAFGVEQVYGVIGNSVLPSIEIFEGSISHFNLFPRFLDRGEVIKFFQPDLLHSFEKTGSKVLFGWWDFKGRAMSNGTKEIHPSHFDEW